MELVNVKLIRLSDSLPMNPWEVIEDTLIHRRPRRSPVWLAEQLGVSIQVVSNWKQRGVPPARYREIANVLGISVDQLEGLEPLPWNIAADQHGWPFKLVKLDEVLALQPKELAALDQVIARELARISLEPTEADIQSARASTIKVRKPAPKRRSA